MTKATDIKVPRTRKEQTTHQADPQLATQKPGWKGWITVPKKDKVTTAEGIFEAFASTGKKAATRRTTKHTNQRRMLRPRPSNTTESRTATLKPAKKNESTLTKAANSKSSPLADKARKMTRTRPTRLSATATSAIKPTVAGVDRTADVVPKAYPPKTDDSATKQRTDSQVSRSVPAASNPPSKASSIANPGLVAMGPTNLPRSFTALRAFIHEFTINVSGILSNRSTTRATSSSPPSDLRVLRDDLMVIHLHTSGLVGKLKGHHKLRRSLRYLEASVGRVDTALGLPRHHW